MISSEASPTCVSSTIPKPSPRGRWPSDAAASTPLAAALRRPHGNVLIGGDSTETSHSDGAVRAGLRMAATVLGQRIPVGAS